MLSVNTFFYSLRAAGWYTLWLILVSLALALYVRVKMCANGIQGSPKIMFMASNSAARAPMFRCGVHTLWQRIWSTSGPHADTPTLWRNAPTLLAVAVQALHRPSTRTRAVMLVCMVGTCSACVTFRAPFGNVSYVRVCVCGKEDYYEERAHVRLYMLMIMMEMMVGVLGAIISASL